jgi:hypothetical protein
VVAGLRLVPFSVTTLVGSGALSFSHDRLDRHRRLHRLGDPRLVLPGRGAGGEPERNPARLRREEEEAEPASAGLAGVGPE